VEGEADPMRMTLPPRLDRSLGPWIVTVIDVRGAEQADAVLNWADRIGIVSRGGAAEDRASRDQPPPPDRARDHEPLDLVGASSDLGTCSASR
jgi:hypothetical protein